MSDLPFRVLCTSLGWQQVKQDRNAFAIAPMLSSSFLLLSLGSGGLEPLIVLCFGDALFNEPFTIASPFVIFILVGSHWHLVTR